MGIEVTLLRFTVNAAAVYLAEDGQLLMLDSDGAPLNVSLELEPLSELTLRQLSLAPAAETTLELAVVSGGQAQLLGELLWGSQSLGFGRSRRGLRLSRRSEDSPELELARWDGGWRAGERLGPLLVAERDFCCQRFRLAPASSLLAPRLRPSALAAASPQPRA